MRKIIIAIFILLILTTARANTFDVTEIANTINGFDNEVINSHEYESLIKDMQDGNFSFDYKKIFNKAWVFLIKEVKNNFGLIIQIILIALMMGLINNIKSSFGGEGVGQIAFYVSYILVATLIIGSFIQVYKISIEAIDSIMGFIKVLLPILFGLVVSTGSITSTSILYPVILFSTQAVSILISTILLPAALIAFSLGIVSNFSNKVNISKIAKTIKSFSIWGIGLILTLFVGIVSLEGTIGSTVDGITAKTTKFLFSNSVPVVGKLLGDSVDTILGSTLVLKDSVGLVGVGTIIGLMMVPIIKIFVLLCIYVISSAVIQPFSDERICKCLDDTADATKLVLGNLICISIMFVIGTVSIMKISNAVAMYR